MTSATPQPHNETFEYLLSFKDHHIIQDILDNGGFTDAEGHTKTSLIGDDEMIATDIAYAFMASVIADKYHAEKIDKQHPVSVWTGYIDLFENYEPVNWWLAEQSVLWATDAKERALRPYWQDLIDACADGKLSSCPYEIDRYDSILTTLNKTEFWKTYNPLIAFGINSLDEFDFDVCSEYADKMSEYEKQELKKCDMHKLTAIIRCGIDSDLSMDFEVLTELYEIVDKMGVVVNKHEKVYVAVEVVETVTSIFYVEVDSHGLGVNAIKDKATDIVYSKQDAGEISFGDGKLDITTNCRQISVEKPQFDYLTAD